MATKDTVYQGGWKQVCLLQCVDRWDLRRMDKRESCFHRSPTPSQDSFLLRYSVPSKTEKCKEKRGGKVNSYLLADLVSPASSSFVLGAVFNLWKPLRAVKSGEWWHWCPCQAVRMLVFHLPGPCRRRKDKSCHVSSYANFRLSSEKPHRILQHSSLQHLCEAGRWVIYILAPVWRL